MDAAEFMRRLREEFPDLREDLDQEDWTGLLYLEARAFARHAQQGIDEHDEVLVRRFFEFADCAARHGDDQVQNAIGVAFLEHLNLQDGKVPRAWAWELLTSRLQADAASLGVGPGYRRP